MERTTGSAVAVCHLISGLAASIFDFAAVAFAKDGGFAHLLTGFPYSSGFIFVSCGE